MTANKTDDRVVPHTRLENEAWLENTYEIGQKIGQGSFGQVFEVIHKKTKMRLAMKTVNKEKAGTSAMRLVEREVAILKKVKHEHIIKLFEVYETSEKVFLITDYCEGGELAGYLKQCQFLSEIDTKSIMRKLASAISYLHKNDIVHRDLKLENILLAENPHFKSDKHYIKVTDFGLSVMKGGSGHENMMEVFCGTLIYMAPEIIDKKAYSQQCDIWAMGVITYTLLSGRPPFLSDDEETLCELITSGNLDFSDVVWENVSHQAKSCIRGMMILDPAHRITALEILEHPWMTGKRRDSTQPKNVLEMMKRWKDELDEDEDDDLLTGLFKTNSSDLSLLDKNENSEPDTGESLSLMSEAQQNKNKIKASTKRLPKSPLPVSGFQQTARGKLPISGNQLAVHGSLKSGLGNNRKQNPKPNMPAKPRK